MTVTIDWSTYLLLEILKVVGLPILIGIIIPVVFFTIRERHISKREMEHTSKQGEKNGVNR